MQQRAIATDKQGTEWLGWWVDPDQWTPEGFEAFIPDDPVDGDPDTIWYVPEDSIRRTVDPPSDRGTLAPSR